MSRPSRTKILAAAIVVLIALTGLGAWAAARRALSRPAQHADAVAQTTPSQPLFPVTINQPTGPPTVDVEVADYHGRTATVACSTCHTTREPDFSTNASAQLDEFHQGLTFKHGDRSCLSCHNADDYDALKLADGSKLSFKNVMQLCAQCHGPQHRDYQHGAHGGMNGFWDRTKGPRQRNNCIDCHDPHAPAYPQMNPALPPRDRFALPPHHPAADSQTQEHSHE